MPKVRIENYRKTEDSNTTGLRSGFGRPVLFGYKEIGIFLGIRMNQDHCLDGRNRPLPAACQCPGVATSGLE